MGNCAQNQVHCSPNFPENITSPRSKAVVKEFCDLVSDEMDDRQNQETSQSEDDRNKYSNNVTAAVMEAISDQRFIHNRPQSITQSPSISLSFYSKSRRHTNQSYFLTLNTPSYSG